MNKKQNKKTGIVGAGLCACPEYGTEQDLSRVQSEHAGSPVRDNIPQIIQWFKTMTTNEYIRNVKQNNWQPFDKKLWQRNYYDHIIRDEKSLDKIREYIRNNPPQWELDRNNPENLFM